MPCYHPIQAYRSREINPGTGRRSLVFNKKDGFEDLPVSVKCGQCIGCRLDRSAEWAIRCHHEASLWEENCFITLTYRDEDLPDPPSVNVRDFQLFMKRLRKKYSPKTIRFFHCGEYGEMNRRPHYHAILFNHDFEDKKLWKLSNGLPLYHSQSLSDLWQLGFCSVGAATFQSAAYVARYIMKKVTGPMAASTYEHVCPQTGVISELTPEYVTMSRRPGLGKDWLSKYRADVWPEDFVVVDGKKFRPPRFYDDQIADEETFFRQIKGRRIRRAKKHADNNTPDRRRVRETVQEARLNQLPRSV